MQFDKYDNYFLKIINKSVVEIWMNKQREYSSFQHFK